MKVFLKYNKNNPTGSICLEKWLKIFKDDEIIIMTDLWQEDKIPEYTPQFPFSRLHDYTCKNKKSIYAEKFKNCIADIYHVFDNTKHEWVALNGPKWSNALDANMTCLDMAKDDEYCWIIDADDITYVSHDFNLIREKLRKVEQETIRRGLDGCSQDMYRHWNDHWSFGVLFIKTKIDLEPLTQLTGPDFAIVHGLANPSIDVAFDVLRRKGVYKLESFIINNMAFVHADPNYPTISIWVDRKNWTGYPVTDDTISID